MDAAPLDSASSLVPWYPATEEDRPSPDPVVAAAEALLGVHYLYPYQRLVVANILEAAAAAGIALGDAGAFDFGPQRREDDACRRRAPATIRPGDSGHDAGGAPGTETAQSPTDGSGGCRDDATVLGRQIVILPTGAGKSLCFQLPALLMARPTLVVYPILSLQSDQQRRLEERGFSPALLRGGQSGDERKSVFRRIRSGEARFVIANPEVLLSPSVFRELRGLGIAHLVVDEAHCVSEWGESFRPSYLRIREIAEETGAPLVTAFTATASPPVRAKIERYIFGDAGAALVAGDPDRPNIRYSALGTLAKDRTCAGLLSLGAKPAIVFCSSRSGTEALSRFLRRELRSDQVYFYHAGLERDEKDAVERWFFGSRDGVLVATCAYGMGVDKADIRMVLHRDLPPSVEAYLQESGRAGRDGGEASAILLYGPEDAAAAVPRPSGSPAPTPQADAAGWGRGRHGASHRARPKAEPGTYADERRSALIRYALDSGRCRRETLLGLLGAPCSCCSGCDVCSGEARSGFREEGPLLALIARNRRRWSRDEAAERIAVRNPWGLDRDEASGVLAGLERRGLIAPASKVLWGSRLSIALAAAPSARAGATDSRRTTPRPTDPKYQY